MGIAPHRDDRLLTVAYRLLGSTTEAEDAVQEAYARWYALPEARRAEVRAPRAWLITTVSRICLDVLGSARARRERYVGEWLPEPVPASARWTSHPLGADDPAELAELDESLDMALLVLLERMTPAERVAFVLHDVFGFRHAEIAEIVGRTPQACRQLASAGRRRVRAGGGSAIDAGAHAGTVGAIKDAWQAGDLERLVRQLDPAVVAIVDGGGAVSAARRPVHGAERVARLLVGVRARRPDLAIGTTDVNGRPGLVAGDASGAVLAVVSLALAPAGRVDRIWVMRNPAKLSSWAA